MTLGDWLAQEINQRIVDAGVRDTPGCEQKFHIGAPYQRDVSRKAPLSRIVRQSTLHLILSVLDDNTLKGTSGQETLRAIRVVANGEAIFSSSIAQRMMQHFDHSPNHEQLFGLTQRESEILSLLSQGLTNAAIAEKLSLSTKTIRNRVSDIFSKLQVHDRTEAILKARDAGLE